MINKYPFLIAEISANHSGSLKKAKKLIEIAKESGADAVKLQTFDADMMTINSKENDFTIQDGIWKGYKLWDLYDKAKTPFEWHHELFKYAKKLKIKIFSSPFSEESVDFLEKLNCPAYKIASFEMCDIALIKHIANKKKPIIISTGTQTLNDIETVNRYVKKYRIKDYSFLYCVSKYPSQLEDFNLNNIKILKDRLKCKIGLSDHSVGPKIATAAVFAGAVIIEKHINLNKNFKSLDSKFSSSKKDFIELRYEIDAAYNLLGKNYYFLSKKEIENKIFRRTIYSIKDVRKGEILNKKNIKRIRPGKGISPIYFSKLLGLKSPLNIKKYKPLPAKIIKLLKLKK